jgi:hypothetical protein
MNRTPKSFTSLIKLALARVCSGGCLCPGVTIPISSRTEWFRLPRVAVRDASQEKTFAIISPVRSLEFCNPRQP